MGEGSSQTKITLTVLPLYVAFGCSAGLLQVAVPSALQASGVGVEAAGMLALLFLPFGLSLLWAPLVDRYELPLLGRRKSWILLCQLAVVTALLMGAIAGPERITMLVAAMAVLSIGAATTDLALDGYMAETSAPEDRAVRGGLKVGGMLLGTAIGSMLVLAMMERVGWKWAILTVAVLSALAALPFLIHKETNVERQTRNWPSLHRFFSSPGMAQRVGLVVLLGLALGSGTGATRLLLVERGFALTVVGTIFGPVSAIAGLVGAVGGAMFGRRFGLRATLLAAATIFCLAMGAFDGVMAANAEASFLVGSVIAIAAVAYGALFGGICALAMGWVSRAQAATDYSIMQSGWTLALVAGTTLAGLGLSILQLGIFLLAGLVVLLALWLLLRSEKNSVEVPQLSAEVQGT